MRLERSKFFLQPIQLHLHLPKSIYVQSLARVATGKLLIASLSHLSMYRVRYVLWLLYQYIVSPHRLTTCPPHRPCAPQIRSQTTCPCNSCGDRKTATEGAGNASGVLFCTLMWRVEKITWLVGSIHCVSYKRYDFIADRLWYSLMKWSHEIKYPHDTNWTYMISTQILPQTNIRTSRWLLTVANRTKRWPLIVRTKEFGICLNPQQH